MIDLEKLTPMGRKQWTKRKYDEYEEGTLYKVIQMSEKAYNEPQDEEFKEKMDKAKWKTTVDRKVNYLLARKPVAAGHQEKLDMLLDFIKESAKQIYLRGSLIWIVQGDGEIIEPQPYVMDDTIAIYEDKSRETPVAFIRRYTDVELQPETGAETEVAYYELYYGKKRDTFCYSNPEKDKTEEFTEAPVFIELGKTGDAPLFAYVDGLLRGFDHILRHQDTTTEGNTDPIVEVKGYSGTDDADLEYAVNTLKIVKTDGNGGLTIHTRSLDSTSIDLWRKALLQEYYEATATVGKDNEIQYSQSGRAIDRLFVDMDNSAKELAHILEDALKIYFLSIGVEDFKIVWNTDRPVDDAEIINGIAASKGILSDKTLLEQHPWVTDVDEELKRLEEQDSAGMEDLVHDIDLSNYDKGGLV